MHEMLSPVTRGQKSLIRTAECLEFFKHPFEMRDDAKRPHFYVNPEQDTVTGVLLPGRDCRAGPGWAPWAAPGPVCAVASAPSLRDGDCPEQPGKHGRREARVCPEVCGQGATDRTRSKKEKKKRFIRRLKRKKISEK